MKVLMSLALTLLFSGSVLANVEMRPDVTGKNAQYLFNFALENSEFAVNKKTAVNVRMNSGCLYRDNSASSVQYCSLPKGNMNLEDAREINKIVMPFLTLRKNTTDLEDMQSAVLKYDCSKTGINEYACWIERH